MWQTIPTAFLKTFIVLLPYYKSNTHWLQKASLSGFEGAQCANAWALAYGLSFNGHCGFMENNAAVSSPHDHAFPYLATITFRKTPSCDVVGSRSGTFSIVGRAHFETHFPAAHGWAIPAPRHLPGLRQRDDKVEWV